MRPMLVANRPSNTDFSPVARCRNPHRGAPVYKMFLSNTEAGSRTGRLRGCMRQTSSAARLDGSGVYVYVTQRLAGGSSVN